MDIQTKEIQEIIVKHLPAQVSELLSKQLARLPILEKENEELKNKVDTRDSLLLDYKTEVNKLKETLAAREKKDADVAIKSEQVDLREKDMLVIEANFRMQESEKRSNELFGLVQMVFKSPVYRKTIQNDYSSTYDNNGRITSSTPTPNKVEEEVI